MALPQQKFRELVFQVLYGRDFGCVDDEEEVVSFLMPLMKVTRSSVKLAAARAASVTPHFASIDTIITEKSTAYAFERISRVEKTILRLGLYELLFDKEIPGKVAIAEAIRMCRKFGTRESANFVNAILDAVYKEKEPGVSEHPREPAPL